ncbi:glycosyltransferase family 4 protein [Flavobacterium soli]|uniref:glycosyltransferase family 4 protein n=1 Tax=Flavobacterium soli TaxID=344881 RepID=UPI00041FAC75|nr:glycosyltransferase family 4 protein [Flavobacterium soli]
MRLIQITAADGWRGHEQKIIYLYESFRDFNMVEDQWIVCRNDSIIKKVALEKGMKVLSYDFKSEYDLKFAKELSRLSNELKADIVFMHSSKAHTLGVLSHLFFGLKAKLVLCRTMIQRVDSNFLRKWKYNYKGIQKIICVSQPVVDVLKYAVKDHSKLTIVGSVIDIHKFTKKEKNGFLHKEFNIPPDYKIIGNIAAFAPMKDIPTWIKAAKVLVDRGLKAKFIIIGEGPLKAEIEQMIDENQLQDHVILAGFRTDIPQCLPEFDLFMFTSNNEPTGGVLLESYACNVPVVAANAGGIPTVVLDNETGLLAEVGNPVDFADKVELLIHNPELQDRFTKNGYEFLLQTGTKEVISRKMFDELQEVLTPHGK